MSLKYIQSPTASSGSMKSWIILASANPHILYWVSGDLILE
jgi:hypothetical protein